MYLHIGMNAYALSERIVAIFEASQGQNMFDTAFLQPATIVTHQLEMNSVKSYVLTTSHEILWSNVSCRTLKKRWNQAMRSLLQEMAN